jgi:hypothetical protein
MFPHSYIERKILLGNPWSRANGIGAPEPDIMMFYRWPLCDARLLFSHSSL